VENRNLTLSVPEITQKRDESADGAKIKRSRWEGEVQEARKGWSRISASGEHRGKATLILEGRNRTLIQEVVSGGTEKRMISSFEGDDTLARHFDNAGTKLTRTKRKQEDIGFF